MTMTDSEHQCPTDIESSRKVHPSPTMSEPDDVCDRDVRIQSSAAGDSRCGSPLSFPDDSSRTQGMKRKRADADPCVIKRPCTTTLETWKNRLLGVEDDLFDAVWSLREDETWPGNDLVDSDALLADAITGELEHVISTQTTELTLVGVRFRSPCGDKFEDFERQATNDLDSLTMPSDLSSTNATSEFEWLTPPTRAASVSSPFQTQSCIVLPLVGSEQHRDVSKLRASDKTRTSDEQSRNATSRTQLIHFGIRPIGSWGQIAGTTFGVMDVPLLRI
jgi:hypothetical protein